jgi:hypothetical protein
MSNFPLYDSLNTNIPDKDLTPSQKKDFMKKIESFEEDAHKIVYALIKAYYIKNEKDITVKNGNFLTDSIVVNKIPYDGVVTSRGVAGKDKDTFSFNLLKFPNRLRQLIYKFLLLHYKKVEEDKMNYSSMAE